MATQRAGPSSRRPPPPRETEPDEEIGDFVRGKEIGKGSFATVYLAQHKRMKSYAAVKVVQMSKLTKKLKENLDSEISILKSLQHPHIVAMFSLVENPVHIYLIMEYCQLSDLSQFMKKRASLTNWPETADIFKKYPNPPHGGLNEVLSRHFLKQIASALEYLRGRNLIHRDIKPQNLLLNPSPKYMSRQPPEEVPLAASEYSLVPNVGVESLPMLKIADFGFARHLPSTSMAETLCGSPLYMAPEILRYEKYDARADLWSTGTVLHEMVVGKPPFRAQNHVDLLRKIEKQNDVIPFDRNITISREMKTLIRKLLLRRPTERITYEELFNDPVVTGEIPGMVGEDQPQTKLRPTPDPGVSELSRRMAKQAINAPAQERTPAEPRVEHRTSREEMRNRATRKPSDQDVRERQTENVVRRKSNAGHTGTAPRDIQRQAPHRERRPSIVAHATAPGRQELYGQPSTTAPEPRMQRRASRASPLSGPPMVREASVEAQQTKHDRTVQKAGRDRTAQDIAFEKEYVVIEKRQVEVNAFADELDANARDSSHHHGAMVRRATTQGQPTSVTGAQPSSPSHGTQMMAGRLPHQRNSSYDRRYAQPSAMAMLNKAFGAVQARIPGVIGLGSSPPFKQPSPPSRGYGAYPEHRALPPSTLYSDDPKTPPDEDARIVKIVEEAGHRSDVVFGFAEVKYRQLLPATPSAANDGLGIQTLGYSDDTPAANNEGGQDDMTTHAIVGVAEEALVLYVKTLSILARTIDLAGFWWVKQNSRASGNDASPRSSPSSRTPAPDVSRRMNNVVQWARARFNDALEKSEIVGRRLLDARSRLPATHPANPANAQTDGPAIGASRDGIQLSTGVTAERLMFERAVEMSRAAAVNELVGEDWGDCELGYGTAVMLLEAVLEGDGGENARGGDEVKGDGEVVEGLEGEDRGAVVSLLEGAKTRLHSLRKKMAQHALAEAQSTPHGSGPKGHGRRPSLTTGASAGSAGGGRERAGSGAGGGSPR